MTCVAYISNQFPSSVEPYVGDEIEELRSRSVRVICCSGKRAAASGLNNRELQLRDETLAIYPLSTVRSARAVRRLFSDWAHMNPIVRAASQGAGPDIRNKRRFFGHTFLGVALADALAPLGVEHIHAHHGYFASWMALVAAEQLRISFSFTLHGSDLLLGRADLLQTKLDRCRFCVTISDFNRNFILEHYPQVPARKVVVLRLGVKPAHEPDEIPARSDGRFSLLSVGRLHSAKNYEFLIRACAALRDEGIEVTCRIAGEGPERPRLERLIESLKLRSIVELPGQIAHAELAMQYRAADLFVLTSHSEGIPVTLMEAMAEGRIVLAPAITGIPELVQHGRNGFLYEPGSMPDFLRAVRMIVDRRGSLGAIGRAATGTISTFYDRRKNLRKFGDEFLARIGRPNQDHAHSLLQQVQLSI